VGETTLMDDDRANFLRGNKQHLLYFWHVMDTCDLLPNTLTVLPNEFSASSDGIPSTRELPDDLPPVAKKNKRERAEQTEDIQFKRHVSESFGHLAMAEGHLAVGSALAKKMEA
jgi:hypothetical protein